LTDEELMLAVRNGDVAKLGTLFERYHAALFDFLSRTTGDRTAAEDLVQEVFVRILKYRRTYRTEDSCFETWAFRIARNARADYFRKRPDPGPPADTRAGDDVLDVPARDPSPARQLESRREGQALRRAMMRLAGDKRELLVLARYHGMSYEQIGQLLGVETGTIKVRVHRALKELKDIFKQLSDGENNAV
jgi:RNA polymerase sigma factor (sigma-70 family)